MTKTARQGNGAGSGVVVDKRALWTQHMAGWKSSGKTQGAYCAEHGLSIASFLWWRRRLREQVAVRNPLPTFLPVAVCAGDAAPAAVIEVELRTKTRLRFEGEAALRAVAALVGRIR